MKIPLPSSGEDISINKIHLVIFFCESLGQKRVDAFLVGDFLWLNSLNVLHLKPLIP